MNANDVIFGFAAVMAVVFLVFLLLFFLNVRLWVQGLLSGVPVSIVQIIAMRLRGIPARLVVHAAIALRHRGDAATIEDIETWYLARGFGSNMSANDLADLAQEMKRTQPGAPRPDA